MALGHQEVRVSECGAGPCLARMGARHHSFRRNSRACAADPNCYGIPVPKWEKAHGIFHMCFDRKRIVLVLLLKSMFQRARPDSPPHIIDLVSSSFPSGHSLMASLTYFTLAALLSRSLDRIRLKAYVLVTAVFLTFMVGLSRIYLGVHWPTDVLAGWAAGASWAAACWLAARWLQSRRKLESE